MNKKIMTSIVINAVLLTIGTVAYAQYGEGMMAPTYDNTGSQSSSQYNMGVSALNNKDYNQALEYFKQALKQDKNNADTMIMIGYTQVNLGNPDDAIASLKAALQIQPRSAKAREFLGEAYIRAAVQEMDTLNSYGDLGQEHLQKLGVYFTTTYENLVKCKFCSKQSN